MKIRVIIKTMMVMLFLSTAATSNVKSDLSIDVSVFDGQGGLLIDWSFDEKIIVKSLKISSKKIGETSFKTLKEFNFNIGRYLDILCEPNERYYYKIEIIDEDGKIYTSDLNRPSFGACLGLDNSTLSIQEFKTLESGIIYDLLINGDLSVDNLDVNNLFNFIQRDSGKGIAEWIENFPLNFFQEGGEIVNELNFLIEENYLINKSSYYESLFRNKMLITPDEWESNFSEVINDIEENLSLLAQSHLTAIKYIEGIEPVRVTAVYSDIYRQKTLNLYFFHPEVFLNKELLLLNNNEYIEVDVSEVSAVRNQKIVIPEYWNNVSLMIDDTLLNEYDIIKNKNIIYTLNNEIISMQDEFSPYIKLKKDNSELWLNEIQWNHLSSTLDLELAKKIEPVNKYLIMLSSEIIWQINKENFNENFFIDSTFTVKNLNQNVISIGILKEDEYKDLEFFVLGSKSFLKARNKDFIWKDIKHHTFGNENKITNSHYDESLLPELFVLYQNYPNPFNGQTRISFDLIDDAMVSLFISDAKGRIHESFLDKEFINSGSYSFTWNGEKRSTGIYFITLQAQVDQMPPAIFSRKMIYLK
jgi:hypothetical protein